MSFQIHALSPTLFAHLFALTEDELAGKKARRLVADAHPGFPCRVSLVDAQVGEEVILLNHRYQPGDTPYQASHAIFVRQHVEQARPGPNELPETLESRLLSVRAFTDEHDMIDADVAEGEAIKPTIRRMFENPAVDYLHLHFARRGCFAASVSRT